MLPERRRSGALAIADNALLVVGAVVVGLLLLKMLGWLVGTVFLLALPGWAVASALQLPLAWDGASKLLRTLHDRSPYIPHDRHAGMILKWPVLLAQAVTDDALVLRLVYSATYAAVPLLALALSWLVVRREAPWLFVWPSLGILVATLPGQAFTDNEALVATHLAWPLLLSLLLGLRAPWQRYLAPVLVVTLFFLHPTSAAAFLAGAGLCAAGVALRRLPMARMLTWSGLLIVLAVVRFSLRDDFETRQSSLEVLLASYRGSVEGPPARALLVALAIGVLLALARPGEGRPAGRRRGLRLAPGRAVAVLLVLPALWLLPWAASPSLWGKALQYRAWCLLVTLPFVGLAALDCWRRPDAAALPADGEDARRLVAAGSAALFSLVLVSQAIAWWGLVGELEDDLARADGGCLALDQTAASSRTATRHWATSSLAVVLQGRRPDTLVLADADECAEAERGGTPPVVGSGRPLRDEGWVILPDR